MRYAQLWFYMCTCAHKDEIIPSLFGVLEKNFSVRLGSLSVEFKDQNVERARNTFA